MAKWIKAVVPRMLSALASDTPGSSIEIWLVPTGWTLASETPRALTRFCSTGMVSVWAWAIVIPFRGPERQGGSASTGLSGPWQMATVSSEPPTMSSPLWRVML